MDLYICWFVCLLVNTYVCHVRFDKLTYLLTYSQPVFCAVCNRCWTWEHVWSFN